MAAQLNEKLPQLLFSRVPTTVMSLAGYVAEELSAADKFHARQKKSE